MKAEEMSLNANVILPQSYHFVDHPLVFSSSSSSSSSVSSGFYFQYHVPQSQRDLFSLDRVNRMTRATIDRLTGTKRSHHCNESAYSSSLPRGSSIRWKL